MKRRWNVFVWAGFLVILAAFFTYLPFFSRFPITRDFPWANLLLFAGGWVLLTLGLMRAFREPQLYRGKVSGLILETLSVLLIGFFVFGIFLYAKQLPASSRAPQVGQKAPDFTLADKDGNPVSLSTLLASPGNSGGADQTHGVVLIFYRGYW